MAQQTIEVIEALRQTAHKLHKTKGYQWGHMGSCNCGYLAREVTKLSKKEIHRRAMHKYGDWNDQLNDYCPSSGLLMDNLITQMLDFGFSTDDLKHLERLTAPEVLQRFPKGTSLRYNQKDDVIRYLNAWAAMLEERVAVEKLETEDVLS